MPPGVASPGHCHPDGFLHCGADNDRRSADGSPYREAEGQRRDKASTSQGLRNIGARLVSRQKRPTGQTGGSNGERIYSWMGRDRNASLLSLGQGTTGQEQDMTDQDRLPMDVSVEDQSTRKSSRFGKNPCWTCTVCGRYAWRPFEACPHCQPGHISHAWRYPDECCTVTTA